MRRADGEAEAEFRSAVVFGHTGRRVVHREWCFMGCIAASGVAADAELAFIVVREGNGGTVAADLSSCNATLLVTENIGLRVVSRSYEEEVI